MNKLLENNLYVRLIALFLAIILWLYVVNEHSPQIQRTFTIPIKYNNLAANLTLLDKVENVEVKITGLNDNVLALDQSQIKAEIDLKGVEEGNYYLPLKITAPFTVKIAEFKPEKVQIALQNIVSKKVALVPQLKGTKLEKESVSGIAADLKEVKVTGPEKQVEKVALGLAVADISQLISNKVTVKITPVDELGQTVRDVHIEPKFTQIFVSTLPLKQLVINPVLVGKPAYGYKIKEVTVVPNAVKVSGEHLEKLNSLKTLPIDITGLDSNIQKETELILPGGVMALEKQSVKVLLLVEQDLQEKKFTHLPISIRGGANGLVFVPDPAFATVLVNGREEDLNRLKVSDIALFIDVKQLTEEGTFNVHLNVNLPEEIKLQSLEPEKLQVQVKKKE